MDSLLFFFIILSECFKEVMFYIGNLKYVFGKGWGSKSKKNFLMFKKLFRESIKSVKIIS